MQNRAKHAEAHFLNVDFEVYSRRSLEPLIDALGDSVLVMHYEKEGRRYAAHLEPARPAALVGQALGSLYYLGRRQ